jgi:hypothetical protein
LRHSLAALLLLVAILAALPSDRDALQSAFAATYPLPPIGAQVELPDAAQAKSTSGWVAVSER